MRALNQTLSSRNVFGAILGRTTWTNLVSPEHWSDTVPKRLKQALDQPAAQSTRDQILRDAEVRERTGLSRTTRWRLVKAKRFPAPVKLTEHAVGWRESEIAVWLASRERAA
jgi:prophage regulatory protein